MALSISRSLCKNSKSTSNVEFQMASTISEEMQNVPPLYNQVDQLPNRNPRWQSICLTA